MGPNRMTTSSRTTVPFTPKPQETPLNQKALIALENLKKQDSNLQITLKRAAELLTGVVNDVNERAWEDRQRRRNRLDKLLETGEQETEEAKQEHEELQKKVEALTSRMDESIRQVVDDQMWAEGVGDSVRHVITKSKDTQSRGGRRDRVGEDGDDQEEEDEEPAQVYVDPSETSTALLHAAQSTAETRWNAQTLTERYSQNPTYAEFYKMKHYAQYSAENAPPLPHHSMWFALQEGRNTQRTMGGAQRRTQREGEEEEDDSDLQAMDEDTEIQVASENRSCKCPLTFTWFVNPVTSIKCPHSFEKSAIIEVIRASNEHVPLTSEQVNDLNERFPRGARGRAQAEASMRVRNPKVTQCPEQGCHMQLTEQDVREDSVLKKQTQRAKELEQRRKEHEEAEDDDEEGSGDDLLPTQRRRRKVFAIGSSPATERRRTLIKGERNVSVVPNSQSQAGGSRRRGGFMDVDDADENSEDEDEDRMEE